MTVENYTVYNSDVAGLHRRINRFVFEMMKSASSNVSQTSEADQVRLTSYLGALRKYRDWVIGQPILDLPETNQTPLTLDQNPETPTIENESLEDVIRMFETMRDEMDNSQSARVSSNFIEFDTNRLTASIEKIQAFLENYIGEATPLDLPESSPMRDISGLGRTGT